MAGNKVGTKNKGLSWVKGEQSRDQKVAAPKTARNARRGK